MTFAIASNGVIHRDGCEHAARLLVTNSGIATVEEARRYAREDFSKVRVAPCAKQVTPSARTDHDDPIPARPMTDEESEAHVRGLENDFEADMQARYEGAGDPGPEPR